MKRTSGMELNFTGEIFLEALNRDFREASEDYSV